MSNDWLAVLRKKLCLKLLSIHKGWELFIFRHCSSGIIVNKLQLSVVKVQGIQIQVKMSYPICFIEFAYIL